MSKPNTPNQLINWATSELNQSSETAKLDAKILLRHVTGYSDVDLILKADQKLRADIIESYQKIISKRQQGMPVVYLTGQKEFWSLNFKVTADTLIPRPETELLVETALKLIPKESDFDIADLGTGSGAIACAIASERCNAKIIATDQSIAALAIAKENTRNLGLTNIDFVQSDWFENISDKKFDLIISNPPYVAQDDQNLSQGDVRFEPDLALTSGPDGLDDLKQIIEQGRSYLKTGGYLLVEHGYDQEETVKEIFLKTQNSKKTLIPIAAEIQEIKDEHKSNRQPAYKNIICLKDLNNLARITFAEVS